MNAPVAMPHAAADELRWEARRLLRQATALLLQAGPDPHRAIWFHHGNEVELFAGTEPLASRDPDDALEMVLYHLLEQRQRNVEKSARAARQAEVAVRRAALREAVIQGGKA